MTPVRILSVAQAEFEDAIAYYREIRDALALDFDAHYKRHVALIGKNPHMRQVRRFAIRYSYLTPQFREHYIAYILNGGEIIILALGHSKREPQNWRVRLQRPPRQAPSHLPAVPGRG